MEGFLNPSEILNKLELHTDAVAADFGCGSGGWALPLAKKLKEGKVYAIDILEEPLSALSSRVKLEKVSNIETILADVEKEVPLPTESCDLVLMSNLLFQVEDKEGVFKEALRVLKKDGKILVVDWKKEAPLGPKEGRVSAEEVKEMVAGLGLKLEKEFPAGAYHYGLIFLKPQ